MPSVFHQRSLSFGAAETELERFKAWFEKNSSFGERAVVRELKKHEHLSMLLGTLATTGPPDRSKFEFEIQGVFRADYAAGSSSTGRFAIVEFEGGEQNSLFGPRSTNQMRDWGEQVQHGFSQLADWTWAINDAQNTDIFRNATGVQQLVSTFVLICGRDGFMDQIERRRLTWRHDRTQIAGCGVLFMTYDDMIAHFESALDLWRAAREEARL